MMHFLLLHGVAFHISQLKKKAPKLSTQSRQVEKQKMSFNDVKLNSK